MRHLATPELWWVDGDRPAAEAAAEMAVLGYDVAPVREAHPHRYAAREGLLTSTGTVAEKAQPIGMPLLVTRDLGLMDAVLALERSPFFLVLDSRELVGVVTWADLQRPSVSMAVLATILACESALAAMIAREYGDSWPAALAGRRRSGLEEVYAQRRRSNTEIARFDCLMLRDRLALVRRRERLRQAVGFDSVSGFSGWERELTGLRNVLAHGGTVLDYKPMPAEAIALLKRVHEFGERCCGAPATE